MKQLSIVVMLALVSLFPQYAYATDGPGTKRVRQTNDAIQALLLLPGEAGSPEEKALGEQIVQAIRGLLDVEELGKRALQDHIKSMSSGQVEQFLALLRALIEQSYVDALLSHRSYKVSYLRETAGATRVVLTEVHTTRKGRPYTVTMDYQLAKVGADWRAYDVVTDGVSLVRNYRAQFNRIIAKEGFPGLMARMQKRYSQIR